MKRDFSQVSTTTTTTPSNPRNLVARLLSSEKDSSEVELLRVVIQDKYSSLEAQDLKPCGHAELAAKIFSRARPAVLQAASRLSRCDLCEKEDDIWLCLTCLGMFCSREDQGHGYKHFQDTGHCVILSLASLNFWCYAHEQYLEYDFYPSLFPIFQAVYQVRFGEPPPITLQTSSISLSSPEQQPMIMTTTSFCSHVESAVSKKDPPKEVSLDTPCKECNMKETWVCLTCFQVHCGRYSNKHMIQHNQENPGHDVCLNLKDLSIWCQKCQSYLDTFKHPTLSKMFNYFHQLKFKDEALPEPLQLKRFTSLNNNWIDDLDFSLLEFEG